MQRFGIAATSVLLTLVALVLGPIFAQAADHRDGSVALDPSADIADTYAFVNPNNPANVVLAVTVNPFTVPGVSASFSTDVLIQLKIDNTGDFVEDLVIQAVFDQLGADQQVTLLGPAAPLQTGAVNTLLSGETVPMFMGPADGTVQTAANGMQVFVGRVDDPFFADLIFVNSLTGAIPPLDRGPGLDQFAGFNVSVIAVELPATMVTGSAGNVIRVWSTASRNRTTTRSSDQDNVNEGEFIQIERQGLPGINTFLVNALRKDEFNRGEPANDAVFREDAAAIIATLNGGDTATAMAIAEAVLPNVLTLDTTRVEDIAADIAFINGRRHDTNVVDVILTTLTNGAATTDGVVGNDVLFLTAFPFFAPERLPSEPIPPRN